MMDLLPFIPPVYHEFFNNLKPANVEDNLGLLPYQEEVPDEADNIEEESEEVQ